MNIPSILPQPNISVIVAIIANSRAVRVEVTQSDCPPPETRGMKADASDLTSIIELTLSPRLCQSFINSLCFSPYSL